MQLPAQLPASRVDFQQGRCEPTMELIAGHPVIDLSVRHPIREGTGSMTLVVLKLRSSSRTDSAAEKSVSPRVLQESRAGWPRGPGRRPASDLPSRSQSGDSRLHHCCTGVWRDFGR
jgi:hypothetical protein